MFNKENLVWLNSVILFYTVAPLPCIIKRVTVFIATLGDEKNNEQIDVRFRVGGAVLTFEGKKINGQL